MMNGWDMNGWGWAWMTLTMLIGASLVVLTVVLLYRGSESGGQVRQSETPVETLSHRFARGEIDEAEFRRCRDALQR